MKGTKSLSLLLATAALAAAACTTKFKDVDTEEEEDVADDDRDADADVRDDGDARDDNDPGEDREDGVEADGDVERQCDSGPCCETSLGVFMDTSSVCDSRMEHSCGTEGCGADARQRTVEQHCSGSSPDCNGETVTLPDTTTDCTPDQVCDTDGTTYAVCVTCDDGCSGGSCNNPDCDGGPCCNTTTGTFRPADFRCDGTPVATETQCAGTCGGQVQQRDSYRYCSGIGAACDNSNIRFDDWRTVTPCGTSQVCRMDPTARCESCSFGCDTGAGACYPQCSPADPCCDGAGRFRPASYQCSAIPDHTTYACAGTGCGANAYVSDYMPFCTGTSADCGTSNLQEAMNTVTCGPDAHCVTSGPSAPCETCTYACYNDLGGVAVCYDDQYERNNTPDEAMARTPHFLPGTTHSGARLDGYLDPRDYYAFDFDESGGEVFQVTATINVTWVGGSGIPHLNISFVSPAGGTIQARQLDNFTAGSYTLITLLSGDPSPPDTFLLALSVGGPGVQLLYDFSVARSPTAIPCGDYQDPFEPNNVVGPTAPLVNFDTHYPGLTLCESYDIHDYYRFTVAATTAVTAHIDFNVVSADDAGISLWLRDGADNPMNSVGTTVSTGNSLDLSYTFDPGTYYVLLTKWDSGDIYYNYDLILLTP